MKKIEFPWSDKIKLCGNLIDEVVRIDITFSKGLNGKLTWYDSNQYLATDPPKPGVDVAWKGYQAALNDFIDNEKKVPIDFLTEDEKSQSWFSFDCKQTVHANELVNFQSAQGNLSLDIFNKTNYNIQQILVFPNFSQKGFGSNCIVALSQIIGTDQIYILMAECIKHSYTESLREFSTLLRKEAIKSAKAAIMSRNISHNLGSHVMAYMKQSLSSVEDMLKNGVLMNALPHEGVNMTKTEIPYLVGIGKFLSYLQERQDYIATVSTDYIPYPSIVNFKDSIYDELNPDCRFLRHPEWTGHKPANILLENIAKSEGLSRKTQSEVKQTNNNIIIQYGRFDGLNQKGVGADDYEKLRQWNFSLPGGIMGRQAVFSIVENVIRNAAKHGTREKGESLFITFDIIDPLVDTENVDIEYNNKDIEDIRDLLIVKLTTSTTITAKDLQKIENAISDSLIEDNGQLKQSNKGIKEMLISAAWLRNLKIEDLDHGQIKKRAPILRAKMVEGKLQYIFCIPKVKEVAMITERFIEDDLEKTVADLMKIHGWRIFTIDDFINCPNKDYCFVIIDSKERNDNGEVVDNIALLNIIDKVKKNSHNRYYVAADHTDITRHLIKTNIFDLFAGFTNDKCFDDIELELYAQLADGKDCRIAIADKEFKDSLSDEKQKAISKKVDILSAEPGIIENYSYIYRKHNDTDKEFKDFVNVYGKSDFNKKLVFVEGITGGNSTDRLVRHTGLDDLWVYKQIHAMKTRVAIFDERIFTKVTGCDMTDLTTETSRLWNFEDYSLDDAKDEIFKYDEERSKKIKDDIFNEWDKLQTIEDVTNFAEKYYPLQTSLATETDNTNSMVFHKKGVDIYTLTWEKDGRFKIWGFVPDESFTEGRFGKIENVGLISIDPQGDTEPLLVMYSIPSKYHYLSIHQGLLDKIYEKFSVDIKGRELKKRKKDVTKALHDQLVKSAITKENDFLEGMIIHSGRSKPNEEDMPQHQPFVQYSAIENAVLDCKYTLVELLDFACFESLNY